MVNFIEEGTNDANDHSCMSLKGKQGKEHRKQNSM
jgi:hypothetical protein